jgi:hypothetical protein
MLAESKKPFDNCNPVLGIFDGVDFIDMLNLKRNLLWLQLPVLRREKDFPSDECGFITNEC